LVLPWGKLIQLGIEILKVAFSQRMTIALWDQHGSIADLLCRNQIGKNHAAAKTTAHNTNTHQVKRI
jgi:hypothetical protein